MNPITKAARATFNFFVGDWIILFGVALALLAVWAITSMVSDKTLPGLLLFVGVVAVLAITLRRETHP